MKYKTLKLISALILSFLLSGCASTPQADYLSIPKAPGYLKKYPKSAPKCKRSTVRDMAICEKKKDRHIAYLRSKATKQARYIRRLETIKK